MRSYIILLYPRSSAQIGLGFNEYFMLACVVTDYLLHVILQLMTDGSRLILIILLIDKYRLVDIQSSMSVN